MCGIAGCVGHEHATEFVTNSLEALERRGYDSAGIAYPGDDEQLEVIKTTRDLGGLGFLKTAIPENDATSAIGHNRWATQGAVTLENAHPHTNEAKTIAVVHNGRIENHQILRDELKSEGYDFTSETDTEVIPHLIDFYFQENGEPDSAFTKTMRRLTGEYAVLAFFREYPDSMYAAKLSSQLALGVNGSEHFAASIPHVIVEKTKNLITLDDFDIASISADGYRSWDQRSGLKTTQKPQGLGEELNEDYEMPDLGDFPHYMLKEIHDQPRTIREVLSGRVIPSENLVKLGGLEDKSHVIEKLSKIERIVIVACGTSYFAGLIGERLIEEITEIPVEVQLASEYKYREEPFDRETAVIAVSQSGETADTIGALEKAKEYGLLTLGVNNAPGSTIDRITEGGVHCRAGQEVSVASTKAFTSQVAVLTEIALALGNKSSRLRRPIMEELVCLPDKIEGILADTSAIEAAAKKYAGSKNFLYIGRGYEHATAKEGALKLKEISYIHAEGIEAAEMKHGTIALIDEDFPTFAIATDSPLYDKTVSNIEEIKARNGPVIALASAGNEAIKEIVDDVIYVPKSLEQTQPILNAVALQLFAYYVALEKGLDVDRPRNLAKSVTVE